MLWVMKKHGIFESGKKKIKLPSEPTAFVSHHGTAIVKSYLQGSKQMWPPLSSALPHGTAHDREMRLEDREETYLDARPLNVLEFVKKGLPVSELDVLRQFLDWPMERLTPKLGMSRATFHRRKAEGRLTSDESDKVVRFARLIGKAIEVFGNDDDARRWLSSPQFGLGGAVPLDYAETEVGAREVEDLLGRIEFGVYS